MARGERGRQLLERSQAGHLLDQVGFTGDVGAPEGGDGDVETVVDVGGLKLERIEDLGRAGAGDLDAQQVAHARVPQPDRLRRRARAADVDRARKHPRAA